MRSLKSPLNLAILAVAVLAAIGLSYYYAPFYTFQQIRKAVLAGDSDNITNYIESGNSRQALAAQLHTATAQSLRELHPDSPLPESAIQSALTLASNSLTRMSQQFYSENYLIDLLIQTHQPSKSKLSDGMLPALNGYYRDGSTFILPLVHESTSGPQRLTLVLSRRGAWTWKLTNIEFPPAMLTNTNAPDTCRSGAIVIPRPFFIPRQGLINQDCLPMANLQQNPAIPGYSSHAPSYTRFPLINHPTSN